MAKCACGKHDIPEDKAQAQAAQAHRQMHEAIGRAHGGMAGHGCGCKGSGQGGLGLRASGAAPGAQPVDQSQGRRMLGLRGL